MKLTNQDQVQSLDPVFGRMAAQVGQQAWSLPQLTIREKAFGFLAADLCTANLGFPLATHVQMAGANGVSVAECLAAGEPKPVNPEAQQLPAEVRAGLADLSEQFAEFVADQFAQRWDEHYTSSWRLRRAPGAAKSTPSCCWWPSTESPRPGARTAPCTMWPLPITRKDRRCHEIRRRCSDLFHRRRVLSKPAPGAASYLFCGSFLRATPTAPSSVLGSGIPR